MPKFIGTWRSAGNDPIVVDTEILGGYRVVADQAERLNIQFDRRKVGMRVVQSDNGNVYKLLSIGSFGVALQEADYALDSSQAANIIAGDNIVYANDEISLTSSITGGLDDIKVTNFISASQISGTYAQLTNLTASGDISSSYGYFANLQVNGANVLVAGDLPDLSSYVQGADLTGTVAFLTASNVFTNDLAVEGNTTLGNSSTDYIYLSGTLTASAGAKVVNGLEVSASNLTVTGDISGSGKLQLGGALTASAMSASGDVTVGGKLSVYGDLEVTGTLTYVNTENLVVADKQIVIATGSTSAQADLAGIYLASDTDEIAKIYYKHDGASWNTDRSLNVAGQLSASTRVVSLEVTGTTTTGSFAKFGDITGSYVSGTQATFTYGSFDNMGVGSLSSKTTNVVSINSGQTGSLPSFLVSQVGAAKYLLKASSSTDVHAIESLVTHNGSEVYYTSYASLYSASPMIRLSASTDGNEVTINVENFSNNNVSVGYLIYYVY